MKRRFGNFFLTIGIVLLILFFLSDYTQQVQIWYLIFGVILFAIGVSLVWQGRVEPEPTRRFRLIRRIFGGKKDERDQDDQD